MLEIAICDDELSLLSSISSLLSQYKKNHRMTLNVTAFQNPSDLIDSFVGGAKYDVLLLDVVMPQLNGIDTAREIREYDKNVKIVFITSSSEFAVESYGVGAFYYQLKPIIPESFFNLMDRVLLAVEETAENSLIVRCSSGLTRIPLSKLEYCEVINRTIIYHLQNGTALESVGKLSELNRELAPYGCFICPHRSYVVNMEYIETLHAQELTLQSGIVIPVARPKTTEVKQAYLAYASKWGRCI